MTIPIAWHLEKRKLKDLKPHPRNPRRMSKHDAEQLENALSEDGLIDKPTVDLNNQIIGGHQRINILKKMGVKEVSVWVPDRELSDKEVDRINLRLNRVHGEFDYDVIANEWTDEQLIDGGFTPEEICLEPEELSSMGDDESAKKTKQCPHCGNEI